MEIPKTPQQIHETLYDGTDLQVSLLDGTQRTVKVRKISRRDLAAFANCFGDEEREAAFYLGCSTHGPEDAGLVEQLTEESFDAVMQEGHRLNFTRFSRWFVRQHQRLQVMGESGAVQTALKLIEESPALKTLLDSTKSSLRSGTATQTSGSIPSRS
jgi:hypothetical protein